MALKQFIVPMDDSMASMIAFRFVLSNFGKENDRLNILWLGKKCVHPEKAIDVRLKNAMAKLGSMNSNARLRIKEVLENEFTDITTNINVVTMNKLTRKQLSNYCDYSDSLICSFPVYLTHIYPLFKDYSQGKKYAKIGCPKVLISEEYNETRNIVLVKTNQVNTIATVKQFCHVYGEKCSKTELNLLDLQEFNERGGVFNSQRMLVDYLKYHVLNPAIYPYSGEEKQQLASILNLNANTIWVSPLESIEEVKFI